MIKTCILKDFLFMVEQYKDVLAVSDNKRFLTYEMLYNEVSTCIYNIKNYVKQGDKLLIYMEKSVDFISAILATMFLGAIYIPIDHKIPINRIYDIISTTNCKTVITNYNKTLKFSNLNIFYYNDLIFNIKIDNKLFFIPKQDSIAYIMFTSGFTGKPKGVKISYNNINNLIHSLFVNIYDYMNSGCFEIICIRNDELNIFNQDIISILKNLITMGYCLLIPVNTFYLMGYNEFNRENKSHEVTISGYNAKKDFFLCKDFFDNIHYQEKEISIFDIKNAIIYYGQVEHTNPNKNIIALRLKKSNEIDEVSTHKLFIQLFSFMNSDCSITEKYYGINWFDGVIKSLIKYPCERDNKKLEMHFISEHIKLMIYRIEYLICKKGMKHLQTILEECTEVYKKSKRNLNLLIKYYYLIVNANNGISEHFVRKETINMFTELKLSYGKVISHFIKAIDND